MAKKILGSIIAGLLLLFFPVALRGQVTVSPFVNSSQQFFDNSGAVCSGCLLNTYSAGTSSRLATYSDSGGTVQNSNPIVLDGNGRATIYLTAASYKFVLTDSGGATIFSQDNVSWATIASTLASLIVNGTLQVIPSTAATASANQSSPNVQVCGNFWNGTSSAADCWTAQTVLGTGTNPSSTLAWTHSGSSGSANITFPSLSISGTLQAGTLSGTFAGNPTFSGNPIFSGTPELNLVQIGSTDTGLSRLSAGVVGVGNGGQGDVTGTMRGASFQLGTGASGTWGFQANGTMELVALGIFGWAASTNATAALDTGVSRSAAATVAIGNGTQGDASGTLKVANIQASGGTALALPTSGAAVISDTATQTLSGKTLTSPTVNRVTVNTGVTAGSGIKHQRFGASCTTGASVGAACNTTYTWAVAFADANYTISCTSNGTTSGVPVVINTNTKTASTFQVSIAALTAVAAQASGVDCIAFHD